MAKKFLILKLVQLFKVGRIKLQKIKQFMFSKCISDVVAGGGGGAQLPNVT